MVKKEYKISDPLILKKTCCFVAESGRLGVKHQFTYLLTPGRTGQAKNCTQILSQCLNGHWELIPLALKN